MKTKKHILDPLRWKFASILAVPFFAASLAAEPAPTAGLLAKDERVEVKHAPAREVTFLGLVTRNADEALTAQLNLSPETGLVVVEVVQDGPTASVLKENDLLVRFDDQLLIEPRQLGVLVRSHKEGDEVKLTFFRGGKQQTVGVKLTKRTMPEASLALPHNKNKFFVRAAGEPMTASAFTFGEGRPGEMRISRIEHKDSVMFFEDGKGRLEISYKNGKKFLVARNDKNDVIFSGPVDTAEQRKAMPEEVRERLEKMEATDVKIPVPPVPPAPPGMRTHNSSMTIYGNEGDPELFETAFVEEGAS